MMNSTRVGDVILFDNRKSFFGFLVGKFTSAKYTHAGIVYEIADKHLLIAEAIGNGFSVTKYSKKKLIKRLKKSTIEIRRSRKTLVDVKKNIDALLTTPYAYVGLIKIALNKLFKFNFEGNGDETGVCSEMVSIVLRVSSGGVINVADEFNKIEDFVTPKDLHNSTLLRTIK